MMKKALMAVALFSALPVLAADYSEKTQYLGVVNGQVVGNSVVKVTRTPADPVLYRAESNGPLPETLVITVPAATRQVELEVPANYRGNVQVPVEVEGISAG